MAPTERPANLATEVHALRADFAALNARLEEREKTYEERDRRYEERDEANKRSVATALTAVDRAAEKLEATNKEQREAANEWRGTVRDLINLMPTAMDVNRRFGEHEKKLEELTTIADRAAGGSNKIASIVKYGVLAMAVLQFIGGTVLFLVFRGR